MPAITTNNGVQTYTGQPGEAFSVGGSTPAVIDAAANDTITAYDAAGETIYGAPGDTISTGAGLPPVGSGVNGGTVYAESGSTVVPVPGGITVYAATGDAVDAGSGGATIQDAGDDTIAGGAGPDVIQAAPGDSITAGAGNVTVLLGAGTLSVQATGPGHVTLDLPTTASQATETTTASGATVTAPGIDVAVTGARSGSLGLGFLDGSVGSVNAAIVDHLYQLLLGRAPDPIGLGYWTGLIDSGQATADGVAAGFATSAEFQADATGRSTAQVVQQNLNDLVKTDPSVTSAAVSDLTYQLNAGSPPAQVAEAYSGFSQLDTGDQLYAPDGAAVDVTSLYETLFHRAPDAAGLAFWIGQENAGATAAQVAQGMIGSPEFTAAVAAQPATSTGFAAAVIQQAYGAPDPTAAGFWGQAIDSGGISRAGVVLAYAQSQPVTNEVDAVLAGKLAV